MLLTTNILKGKNIEIFALCWAQINCFAHFEIGLEFLGESIDTEEAKLDSDAFGLDYGLNFGVAYPIGDTRAQVGALYVLGLAKLGEDTKGTFNGLFFNAGYSF